MYEYKARLVRVVDGDTLDLEIDLGFRMKTIQRVRLRNIDAPELRGDEREMGLLVKDFVVEQFLDFGSHCEVWTHKTGKYGRWIADIWFPRDPLPPLPLDSLLRAFMEELKEKSDVKS